MDRSAEGGRFGPCRRHVSGWRLRDSFASNLSGRSSPGTPASDATATAGEIMSRIAVLGAGPAGSFAAERLARAGMRVTLIDEKLAWEKPCGGGLTYKAYNQYPFLIDNDTPKRVITRTCLSSVRAGSAQLELSRPLLIYSRYDLNNMLLKRAEQAGAQVEKTRVTELWRDDSGWRLRTLQGEMPADFCVIANGARNALRDVGTEWSAANKMVALGYYIPVNRDQWTFISSGLCRLHLDLPEKWTSVGRNLRKGPISAGSAEEVGGVSRRKRYSVKGCDVLWPRDPIPWRAAVAIESRGRPGLDGCRRCCGDGGPCHGRGIYYAMRIGSGDSNDPGGFGTS